MKAPTWSMLHLNTKTLREERGFVLQSVLSSQLLEFWSWKKNKKKKEASNKRYVDVFSQSSDDIVL